MIPELEGQPGKAKSRTKIYVIVLVVLFAAMIYRSALQMSRYERSTYAKAERALAKGKLRGAAALFAYAVGEDKEIGSFEALHRLMEMKQLEALATLIDLIDLEDLHRITAKERATMCNMIRQRTAGTTADSLSLDPHASQEVRAEQKRQWQAWLTKAKEEYNWQDGRFVPKQQE